MSLFQSHMILIATRRKKEDSTEIKKASTSKAENRNTIILRISKKEGDPNGAALYVRARV